MFTDIHNLVQSCNVCSQSKINRKRKPCPLSPIPPVGPFQRVHVDLFGPLKECQGFKYILVCIESFSRFPECIPLRGTSAEELASAIYNSIITRYGAVSSILSDLGSNLTSRVFKCLSDMMGFTHLKTSSFHPQSNAFCEKWNQNIIHALRLYCTDQEKWLDYIPPLLYSYRATSAIKTIKTSPFEALFGQKMKLPIDLSLIPTKEFHDDVQKYVQDMVPKLALTEKNYHGKYARKSTKK